MKKILRKFIPKFIRKLRADYLNAQYRKSIRNKPVKEVFSRIYKTNFWGDRQSVSGGGSNEQQTAAVVKYIPTVLRKYQITSILDLPCGDFNWMRHVDLQGVQYTGGDIIEELIRNNRSKYAKEGIKFEVLNIISDKLPAADLLLCRDCWVHFSNDHVKESLHNIRKYPIKYLLTTSFVNTPHNTDIVTGEWRPLNLEIAPFNLHALETMNENYVQADGLYTDKSLILVDLTK